MTDLDDAAKKIDEKIAGEGRVVYESSAPRLSSEPTNGRLMPSSATILATRH